MLLSLAALGIMGVVLGFVNDGVDIVTEQNDEEIEKIVLPPSVVSFFDTEFPATHFTDRSAISKTS
jgi:hypothetical protein